MLSSCNKDEGFDCFKSTGSIITEDREVGNVNHIELHNNINLYLTQDTIKDARLVVEAGENLLSKILTDTHENTLVIRNQNTCNWVRSFEKPINVYLSLPRIDSIMYRSSGDLVSMNTITNDSIKLDVWEGAGSIILDIQTIKSEFYIHYGTAYVEITGHSSVNFIASLSHGQVNCLGLQTGYTYMRTTSPNDCYVNASTVLSVEIDNIGNVYYKGDPSDLSIFGSGSGSLIKLE